MTSSMEAADTTMPDHPTDAADAVLASSPTGPSPTATHLLKVTSCTKLLLPLGSEGVLVELEPAELPSLDPADLNPIQSQTFPCCTRT